MSLAGFQYEPVGLDVNEICFDVDQNIPNTPEKSRKIKNVNECGRCEECRVMDTNVVCLSCGKVENLEYLQILDMRYDDGNAVTERISTTVL